ncbi:MAG: PAS domain S-box protein [Deltaproteobacteria bacterium]|nr:PAS domain S-box protein [Deltaproteobacteria bacterium]
MTDRRDIIEKLAAIVESSDDAIVSFDLAGRVLTWNRSAECLFGYRADEMVEQPLARLLPHAELATLTDRLAQLERGAVIPSYESQSRRKDGSTLLVAVRLSPIVSPLVGEGARVIGASMMARDISEQARTRTAAHVAKVGVDASPFPAIVHNEDGEILAVNQAWQELSGYRKEQLPTIEAWTRLAYRDRQQEVRILIESTTYSFDAMVPEGEFVIVTASGAERTWDFYSGPLGRDGEGRRLVLSTAADITERKRMEEALRANERFVRRVLNGLFAFVGVLTPDGTLIDVNEGPLEVGGVRIEDVVGKKFWDCYWWSYSPEVQRELRAAIDRAARGETLRYDVVVRVAGEGRMWIDFQLAPLRDDQGKITHLVPSGMDLSQRKQAEEALRESEERYRLAVEGGALGTWTYDGERGQAHWDARAREIFGLAAEGPIDLSLATSVIHPEDLPRTLAALEQSFERGGPYQAEKRIMTPAGELRWVRTWGLVSRLGGERSAPKLVGLVQDITAQKRAELALEEASRRKDDYLAMLSHELRNPLAVIRMAGELIKQQSGGLPGLARAADALERQSAHMAKLLDGLLDVSRITRGKLTLEKRELQLGRLLEEVVADLGGEAERKGIQLRVDLPARADLLVYGDPARLTQVFVNLIVNAIKFTDRGGSITVTATSEAEQAIVVVRDNGAGFTPDLRERLFEPFQQGPQDISRRAGGLGLGLAVLARARRAAWRDDRGTQRRRGPGVRVRGCLPLSASD